LLLEKRAIKSEYGDLNRKPYHEDGACIAQRINDMGKLTPIKHQTNTAAIQILEAALAEARTGNIIDVSISWVTSEMAIGGDFSGGGNNIMMWASIEHSARSFYSDIIPAMKTD